MAHAEAFDHSTVISLGFVANYVATAGLQLVPLRRPMVLPKRRAGRHQGRVSTTIGLWPVLRRPLFNLCVLVFASFRPLYRFSSTTDEPRSGSPGSPPAADELGQGFNSEVHADAPQTERMHGRPPDGNGRHEGWHNRLAVASSVLFGVWGAVSRAVFHAKQD